MKAMFPYSFGCALQESVVKIEFSPVGNPIWRQYGEKYQKIGNFFFHNFVSYQKCIGT